MIQSFTRTEEGLHQFFLKESRGVVPENPDPYYEILLDGKKWWEWLQNYIAEQYTSKDMWFGWMILKEDYKNDPSGYKQIRQRVKSVAKKYAARLDVNEKDFENIWKENDK
jgi:hypothetical protein